MATLKRGNMSDFTVTVLNKKTGKSKSFNLIAEKGDDEEKIRERIIKLFEE